MNFLTAGLCPDCNCAGVTTCTEAGSLLRRCHGSSMQNARRTFRHFHARAVSSQTFIRSSHLFLQSNQLHSRSIRAWPPEFIFHVGNSGKMAVLAFRSFVFGKICRACCAQQPFCHISTLLAFGSRRRNNPKSLRIGTMRQAPCGIGSKIRDWRAAAAGAQSQVFFTDTFCPESFCDVIAFSSGLPT